MKDTTTAAPAGRQPVMNLNAVVLTLFLLRTVALPVASTVPWNTLRALDRPNPVNAMVGHCRPQSRAGLVGFKPIFRASHPPYWVARLMS